MSRVDRRLERGSNAIEFALVFPAFFLLVYGSASYALVLAIQQTLTFAAEEGVRAAVAADPTHPDFDSTVAERARGAVADALAWLPAARRMHVLGAGNQGVAVTLAPALDGEWSVVVSVLYADYPDHALIPSLAFPGLGAVPPLPRDLQGTATGRL